MFPFMTVAGVSTTIITGQLVDRFGAWRLVWFVAVPLIVASALVGFIATPLVVPAIFIFSGIAMGFNTPIVGSILPELYGTAHLGSIRALLQASTVVGTSIGPGVSGLLLDRGVTIPGQAPFFMLFCVVVTAALLLTRARFGRLAALRGELPGTSAAA